MATACLGIDGEKLEDLKNGEVQEIVEAEAAEIREPAWERELKAGLKRLKRKKSDLGKDRKGADRKVALARHLRDFHLAPHRWIAENLQMGRSSYVQSLVSRHRSSSVRCQHWITLKKHEKLD